MKSMTIVQAVAAVFLLSFVTLVSAAKVTGKIESCRGWKLNKLPQLKSFLLDGHVDEYKDVNVIFIPGRNAVLTIFEDGQEREKVVLSSLKTKEDMHKLMVEKGFERKSEEEIAKIAEDKEKDSDRKLEDAKKKMRERYTNLKQNQKKEERNAGTTCSLEGEGCWKDVVWRSIR